MAIDYGSWAMNGSNGMRVGIDVTWSSNAHSVSSITATVKIYTQNTQNYNDDQRLTYGGSISGTTDYTNSTGSSGGTQANPDTARLRATKTYTWTYAAGSYETSPSTRTFTATVSGAFNGVTPSNSVSSAVPARLGTTPDTPGVTSSPGNNTVSIAVPAAPFDGYSAITSYEYSEDNFYYGIVTSFPISLTGTNGTSKTVWVRARNNYGAGPAGSAASTPRTIPGAPGVSSTPNNGSISVSYSAPASDGGNAISSYQRSTDNVNWETSTSNPFTVSGTNGTSVTSYVRAVNDAGAGPSASTSSTPRTTPNSPGVSSTPNNGSISVSYSAPASDGGNAISSYQYSTDNSTWTTTPSNPFTINGANGTAITIYVRAVNAAGGGGSASTASTPRTTPGAPTNVTSTPGNGSVSIAFGAPSSDGGNAVSAYQYSTDNSTFVATPSNPFTINGANGTPITIYVRAVNAAGGGTSASATSTPRQPPSAPTSFAGNNATFAQIGLSWGAPSSNGGNAVTSYVLRNGSTILQNSIATSYTHTGLLPYEDYSYTVTAVNAGGEGTQASLTIKTLGGIAKIWNGTSWVTTLPKVWNGTSWVDAQARMWNGTEWKHGI
jgi:titin